MYSALQGHTALSIAAYNGGESTVRLLASLGAAINGVPGSQIPLHSAAMVRASTYFYGILIACFVRFAQHNAVA